MNDEERQYLKHWWGIDSDPVFSTATADFWVHRDLTKYVRHDRSGEPIKKHKDWLVLIARMKDDGEFNLVLYDGHRFIDDSSAAVDAMAVKCDFYVALAMYEEET